MEPNSREFYKQCAFQKFCNTVLHNEACDTHRELRRHKAKEVTFSDMTLDEARQLHTFDEYFKREAAETVFEKAGKKITPKLLLEAIRTLPEEKRKQTTLDGDKQLVHISLVGLPAAAEIRIGQFHISAAFLDIYLSRCVFHCKYLPSEFLKCSKSRWRGGERHLTPLIALWHFPTKNDKRKTAKAL